VNSSRRDAADSCRPADARGEATVALADAAAIARAARLLRDGRLVAFPTETVYGLGADASNPRAVARIFEAKGRPAEHPVIVHVADIASAGRWAASIPAGAPVDGPPGGSALVMAAPPLVAARRRGRASRGSVC
jgi:tRNA A37 threonylcarbamoyladenosine synthetase subunit TsaC/SUA5/YrdC